MPLSPTESLSRRDWVFRTAHSFHREHDHLFPRPNSVIDGINVCHALDIARRRYRGHLLSSKTIACWNSLGMIWNPAEVDLAWGLTACRRYRAREGHLRPPPGHYEIGIPLDVWLTARLQRAEIGHLDPTEHEQLVNIAPELFNR
ncbi:hypothetical protein Ato02nite_097590 [Paractinoplanes toevensis]|uniref:Uncharacterized protein n=1 Tax=Paractinoplanes toevensis TaxID=571911 RepID=A0A920BRU2_9ACTN|nr:hypothetical protein Ato02nite_097590 [Actinoplanes toevensis]